MKIKPDTTVECRRNSYCVVLCGKRSRAMWGQRAEFIARNIRSHTASPVHVRRYCDVKESQDECRACIDRWGYRPVSFASVMELHQTEFKFMEVG